MKMMKLMMAITLATVSVISVFMESAAAQRKMKGNTYDEMNTDQQNIFAQFNLVNTTRDGNPITDKATDPNIGLFLGAIQDYTRAKGEVCRAFRGTPDLQRNCPREDGINVKISDNSPYLLDSSGFPIFNPDIPFVPTASPFDGDLRAEYIENDPLFAQGGTTRNTIAYSIFKAGEAQPLPRSYRLDFLRFGIDKEQAINNLSYILEQNILGKATSVVSIDGSFRLYYGSTLIQNRFERDVPATTVFEPSTTLGALAVLSAGLRLKRKVKQI